MYNVKKSNQLWWLLMSIPLTNYFFTITIKPGILLIIWKENSFKHCLISIDFNIYNNWKWGPGGEGGIHLKHRFHCILKGSAIILLFLLVLATRFTRVLFAHGYLLMVNCPWHCVFWWGYFLRTLATERRTVYSIEKPFCILRLTDYSCYLLP